MDIVTMAAQLMLSLSILIVLHELGHFTPAKLFKTRVEKFYLFFDPWFSLFKVKKGETEYGVGWLPLGGYVKIAGMVDESFDTEKLKAPPQPWEFRSKPAWQRLIIMLGGVTVNFILGFLIFGIMLFAWGEEYLPSRNIGNQTYVDSLGYALGLRDGDQILKLGDQPFTKFNDRSIVKEIVINDIPEILVNRGGSEVRIPVDDKFVGILSSSKNKDEVLMGVATPGVVATVLKDSPAEKAGLKAEDRMLSMNSVSTPYFHMFKREARKNKGQDVDVAILRGADTMAVHATVREDGTLGFLSYNTTHFFDTETEEYSLGRAIPAGFVEGWGFLADQIKAFGQMFKGKIKASESLGGFGTIGKMFGSNWDWYRFWRMTAILSLILGFMNLLPIPALDGGHVMFLLWEMVTGHKPSDKFLERATLIGFILVILLVVYANGLDFLRGCN